MSDLFISYARENRELAEDLARALQAQGISVWWDRDLKGGTEFATVIEQQLAAAKVVMVLWSEPSVRSGFVRDESTRALEAGKLLPVRIEEVALPLGFGQIHTLDLFDWDGDATDPGFTDLVHEVRQRMGQTSVRPEARPRGRWRSRPRLIMALVALAVLIGAAFAGYRWHQSNEADANFRQGLEQQFAREPNLESARNFYLDALERVPTHARSRYYLGHVYAQLGQRELAQSSFARALADRSGLDAAQEADARANAVALAPVAEPAALSRTVSSRPAPAPTQPVAAPPTPPVAAAPEGTAGRSVQGAAGSGSGAAIAKRAPKGGPIIVASTASFAPAQLPRVEPSLQQRERVSALVDQMFGTDSEARIAATTTLVTSPELLSDAVPIALDLALAKLGGGAERMPAAAQSGVVNTLVLLQSALPGTLTVNRADIERLLKSSRAIGSHTAAQADKVQALLTAAAARRPVAFIQIANEAQRPLAESLAVRLRAAGYDSAGVELVGDRAPQRSQLRIQGKSDRGLARWLAKVVGDADGEVTQLQTLRNASPNVDTFEIWFDRDLCTPARAAPNCRS